MAGSGGWQESQLLTWFPYLLTWPTWKGPGLLLGWCELPVSQWGRGRYPAQRRGRPHPAVSTMPFFLKHFNIH